MSEGAGERGLDGGAVWLKQWVEVQPDRLRKQGTKTWNRALG